MKILEQNIYTNTKNTKSSAKSTKSDFQIRKPCINRAMKESEFSMVIGDWRQVREWTMESGDEKEKEKPTKCFFFFFCFNRGVF